MIHLLILAVHLLATIAKLLRPGGVRAVVAESVLLRHQLVISSRTRRRAPFERLVNAMLVVVPRGDIQVTPCPYAGFYSPIEERPLWTQK
jgi:hypothetical protein